MSQVDDFQLEKQALRRLELQVKLPEPLEHHVEALQVLLLSAAKDDDIIQVNHAVHEIQLFQRVLHKMLKSHRHVTQPKWHAGDLIESEVTHHKGVYCCNSGAILICQKPDLKSIEKCADPAMLSNAS